MPAAGGDCVFCAILAGDLPASMVYEDEICVAFMDTRPVTPGHTLVIPRHHAPHLADLDPAAGGQVFQAGMRVAAGLRQSGLRCEGVNLFLADGEAAMQEVFHVHLHVLPRYSGDGFGLTFPEGYGDPAARPMLDEQAARIADALR